MKIEVLTASCCSTSEVEERIVSELRSLSDEIPGLDWSVVDIAENPELPIKYKAPMTPAIVIDGKLQYMGIQKKGVLATKIRELARGGQDSLLEKLA